MDKKTILSKIGGIARAAKKLTADIQSVAIECLLHAVDHGDVTVADQLVEALGKGMRRASLRAWFERNGCMFIPKGKDTFAFDKERAKTLKAEKREDLVGRLASLPWEEAKPEEPVQSVLDIDAAFDKFMDRIAKQIKEATNTEGVLVKNKDLFEHMSTELARFQAAKILATTRTDGADEEPKAA